MRFNRIIHKIPVYKRLKPFFKDLNQKKEEQLLLFFLQNQRRFLFH